MSHTKSNKKPASKVNITEFGTTQSGVVVHKFTFANDQGCEVQMLSYGATIFSVKTPDLEGNAANIALSCDDLAAYEANEASIGATVGRFCNRIGGAQFTIAGQKFNLTANDGPNTLHGGKLGFKQKVWDAQPIEHADALGVRFTTTSPDGEEGFPGTVEVTVEYLLNNQNELSIEFSATTDKATHLNLTNHCYWNLSGERRGTIYDHRLQINSDYFVDVDSGSIPSGELTPVADSPLDFREAKLVGDDLKQLTNSPQGYDHCFILNDDGDANEQKLAANLMDQASGRQLDIFTDQPTLQFYSSNYMDGLPECGGHKLHSGIALETQHYPDAPNHEHFPSTLLSPGEEFKSKTIFKFSTVK